MKINMIEIMRSLNEIDKLLTQAEALGQKIDLTLYASLQKAA
ncbi:hypothetical protein [Xenorhabdus griffiniae]|nr:hypothetical protein [Xenorhabdus griffiniae]MDC9605605.1 hypothetical protein [Xenorhabdus griffiniae]